LSEEVEMDVQVNERDGQKSRLGDWGKTKKDAYWYKEV
jgi:hypothetical protein